MRKNQARWLALCLAVACVSGCGDDKGDIAVSCDDVKCPTGTVCNPETGKCEASEDKCKDVVCGTGEACNPETGKCEASEEDKCKDVTCGTGEVCNPETGKCEASDKCKDVTCGTGEVCNAETGKCEASDKCAGVSCSGNLTCNAETGECECSLTCDDGEELDEEKCECIGFVECMSDEDCKLDVTYPEYCNQETGRCENGLCKDKEWDSAYQYCAVSGAIQCYDGFCDDSGIESCTCDGECNLETHRCSSTCEEVEGNIVVNGSFEDWTGDMPDAWSYHANAVASTGEVSKSAEASACKTAVRLTSESTKVDRLESYQIAIGEQTFTGGNVKYTCTIDAFGNGKLNLGYRRLNAAGEAVGSDELKKEVILSGSDGYQTHEFNISVDPKEASYIQILLGFRKSADDAEPVDLTLDNLVCLRDSNICDGVNCEEWEICSVSSNLKDPDGKFIGKCVARDGFCTMEKTNEEGVLKDSCDTSVSKCNTETHLCEKIEGHCLKHEDCAADEKCVFSGTDKNKCVKGDRCTDDKGQAIVCKSEWQACNATTGKCELAEGKCLRSKDCPTKELPICNYATHTCAAIDETVDEKPLNIVPNGGFEEWEKVNFSHSGTSTEYDLPKGWFGTEYEIYPTHLVTEFDPKNVHEYTKSVHGGAKALQLVYDKEKQSKRFSSEGFDVPSSGGTGYDCSFFVRGKGSVRIHSFSSLGDMPKTEFKDVDTEDWERVPFSIREGKDLRLVFYVGSTDASKDHIQIDDVSCVKWTY